MAACLWWAKESARCFVRSARCGQCWVNCFALIGRITNGPDPMHYDENYHGLLAERFPPRNPDAERRGWNTLRESFSVGQAVRGVVVSRAEYGAWLDIGAEFPALLLIPDVAGLTPDRYQRGDWCPVGST